MARLEVDHFDCALDRFGLIRAQARRRLDIEGLFTGALRALPRASDALPLLPVSAACTVTLDGLLDEEG